MDPKYFCILIISFAGLSGIHCGYKRPRKIPNEKAEKSASIQNCEAITSCTDCISSSMPCGWCISGHRCTQDDDQEVCPDDIFIAESRVPIVLPLSNLCPRIEPYKAGATTEILIASGSRSRILVRVEFIMPFMRQSRFNCRVFINGESSTTVKGHLSGDFVYCEEMVVTYESSSPNVTAKFDVLWKHTKPLDNPQHIHVVIYKCSEMEKDCSTCLKLPEKCAWCDDCESTL